MAKVFAGEPVTERLHRAMLLELTREEPMACEELQAELDALREKNAGSIAQLQKDFGSLVGSAKSQSPLRSQILALEKQVEAKNAELTSCLVAHGIIDFPVRTKFRPETDGFLFSNNWTWDATEKQTLQNIITGLLGDLEALLSPLIQATLEPLFVGIPPPFDWVAMYFAVKDATNKIVDDITQTIEKGDNETYGLCGGMAFASLDYWLMRWVVPQGTKSNDQPQRTTPEGAALRNYIWSRLLTSVEDNGLKFLQWMGMFGGGGGPGGAVWLLQQTVQEIATLRQIIQQQKRPVTIGLVGTTANPFHNHQVLCYGFKDEPDGTISLFIYDNNHPGGESLIRLDLSGSTPDGVNTVHDDTYTTQRGPLRGLFCTAYKFTMPPKAVVLRDRVSATPSSGSVGTIIDINYTAKNIGFDTSTPMKLVVDSDRGAFVGETTSTTIAKGGQRRLDTKLTLDEPRSYQIAAFADLGRFANIQIVKLLPPQTGNPVETITVDIFQTEWRKCNNCQGLFFDGGASKGVCPAGATGAAHVADMSINYRLNDNISKAPGQNNWRWCKNCQGLFFGSSIASSRCPALPAGGKQEHVMTGSGDYTIEMNVTSAGGQSNWRRCGKCQGMYFNGGATKGVCPAGGGPHVQAGSDDYQLFHM
jgi:hypothetical protein